MTAARKLPAAVEEVAQKRPNILDLVDQGLAGVDVQGFVEAAKEYGDDHERALADLKAGHHPLQGKRTR